jgi:hypothetical protein
MIMTALNNLLLIHETLDELPFWFTMPQCTHIPQNLLVNRLGRQPLPVLELHLRADPIVDTRVFADIVERLIILV